jgi:hypothetical protein
VKKVRMGHDVNSRDATRLASASTRTWCLLIFIHRATLQCALRVGSQGLPKRPPCLLSTISDAVVILLGYAAL